MWSCCPIHFTNEIITVNRSLTFHSTGLFDKGAKFNILTLMKSIESMLPGRSIFLNIVDRLKERKKNFSTTPDTIIYLDHSKT